MDAVSVTARIEQVLADIRARDKAINAFVELTEERALAQARRVDRFLEAGRGPGRLSGVPFAVKNLFDVKGLATLAGSKINRELPPAARDATLVTRLENAGAVLVGTLNMDEYAYGFSTENSHYGPTRNPHDPGARRRRLLGRLGGGGGGGPGAAHPGLRHERLDTGARVVLRGVGIEAHLRAALPRRHISLRRIARSRRAFRAIGRRPRQRLRRHAGHRSRRSGVPAAAVGGNGFRSARCGHRGSADRARGRLFRGRRRARGGGARGAGRCGARRDRHGRNTRRGARARRGIRHHGSRGRRSCISPNLRQRPGDFEPLIRDRLLAGALVPAAWYLQAQRVRRWYYRKVMPLFDRVDVILAPATPRPAQKIGQETFTVRGRTMLARPNAGLLTQPISCIGLPVIAAPVGTVAEPDGAGKPLPVGMQIIAAPWREEACFRVARALERLGVARFVAAAGAGRVHA